MRPDQIEHSKKRDLDRCYGVSGKYNGIRTHALHGILKQKNSCVFGFKNLKFKQKKNVWKHKV